MAEVQLAVLGFDWQVNQPALVATFFCNEALHLGLEKSTDLTNFEPFPFTSFGTSLNGQGRIEFQFDAPDNAAFYLLKLPP